MANGAHGGYGYLQREHHGALEAASGVAAQPFCGECGQVSDLKVSSFIVSKKIFVRVSGLLMPLLSKCEVDTRYQGEVKRVGDAVSAWGTAGCEPVIVEHEVVADIPRDHFVGPQADKLMLELASVEGPGLGDICLERIAQNLLADLIRSVPPLRRLSHLFVVEGAMTYDRISILFGYRRK